jgi:hypothetical protein
MPVTPFQREVLGVIAANRNELSHFAGGLVLHADADSARYSHDFDIFHEAAEDVARASGADVAVTGRNRQHSGKPSLFVAMSASR